MKNLVVILIILTCCSTLVLGQANNILIKVDSLRYLKEEPFACNSVYWRVVQNGKDAIPFLIDRLDDTTHTQISLTCKRTNVKFGDICYVALTEIFNIPLFYVTHQRFDVIDRYGCLQGVLTYIDRNRQKFKSQILNYYEKYKADLKFTRYTKDDRNDCHTKNNIFAYYDVDQTLLDSNQ